MSSLTRVGVAAVLLVFPHLASALDLRGSATGTRISTSGASGAGVSDFGPGAASSLRASGASGSQRSLRASGVSGYLGSVPGAVVGAASCPRSSLERSVSRNLSQKRYVVSGERAYVVGTCDGMFPPMGWHIRGEMGGVWSPPIKLLDGYWLRLNGRWMAAPARLVHGGGYVRFEYGSADGIRAARTEFAPDDARGFIVILKLVNERTQPKKVDLDFLVRSELMGEWPWDWTVPSAPETNQDDEAFYDRNLGAVVFKEKGKRWHAVAGSLPAPDRVKLGRDLWGPVPPEERAKYNSRGQGALLSYSLKLEPGAERIIRFAFAGSPLGRERSMGHYQALLRPLAAPSRSSGTFEAPEVLLREGLLERKIASYEELLSRSRVSLHDKSLESAFNWAKWNLKSLSRRADLMNVRYINRKKSGEKKGTEWPVVETGVTVKEAFGIGAGFPDYPWFFGTDGAYTAPALLASGQFDLAKGHMRLLRDVSRAVNGQSGKIVHEIMTGGTVYFGSLADHGNTNETGQFAKAVYLVYKWTGDRNFLSEMYPIVKDGILGFVVGTMDEDRDLFPEGSGMVERSGMGPEKLDVAAYSQAGLEALEKMAREMSDEDTALKAGDLAAELKKKINAVWWIDEKNCYADSLDEDGKPRMDRHWTGATPLEEGIAPKGLSEKALATLESADFTGDSGLYHTAGVEKKIWTLPGSVMAVAEAKYGRLNRSLFYMRGIAGQLDLEMPGALPEIAPSPDYDPFKSLYERACFLQAWSAYGIQWPVIRHIFGIDPHAARRHLRVVANLPETWAEACVRGVRIGESEVSVEVKRSESGRIRNVNVGGLVVRVKPPQGWELTLGVILPRGAKAGKITLNGEDVPYRLEETLSGTAALVEAVSDGDWLVLDGAWLN